MKNIVNYKRIYQKIKEFEIISFDMFDTLVKRDVNTYKEVFDLLETQIIKRYGKKYIGLSAKRVNAERSARNFYNREITLDEIYSFIDADIACEIKKMEVQIEYELAQPNLIVKPIYDYCIKYNKKIIIISDMYMPLEDIEKILIKCGYNDLYKIYVSGEYGKTKRNGKLYDVVRHDLKNKRLLHIGDNLRSDFVMGSIYGCSCIKIKKEYNYTESIANDNSIKAFINNRIIRLEDDYARRVGYEIYGPFILGYIQWIRKNVVEQNISKIFFASRDGYIMKQVYDLMYGEKKEVVTNYMRVSRRSLQVPLIGIDKDTFNTFLSVSSFAQVEQIANIYNRMGFEHSVQNEQLVQQSDIDSFIRNDDVINSSLPIIIDNATQERKALAKYLDDIGFAGKVAFVDVGWKCSSQSAIEILCDRADVFGYYIGVHKDTNEKLETKGYIFDLNNKSDDFYTVMGGMSVIESVLTSGEASLKRYILENDEVKFEYNQNDVLELNSPVFSVQKGILDFAEDYKKSYFNNIEKEISYVDAFSPIKKIIEAPSKKELKWFGRIQMENMGKVTCILPSSVRMKGVRQQIRLYRNSGWKIGYVKKISTILPAKKIFIILYNLVKGK